MSGAVVMVQGCASSVGKSLIATGLCRILHRRGLRVAPFKAQNMSLNSCVTVDGGEIGRAQAVQAEAAGIDPTVDMNPVLLKPEGEARSQVVVLGRPMASMDARAYQDRKRSLSDVVRGSLERLRSTYDVVVIEGAGSPAEINLKGRDIVNMHVAKMVDAPVLLVGDIDRGGVFAHFVGTLALLDPDERELVKGLIINKFRGDVRLLESGVRMIEERTDVPVLGIVPYVRDLRIADEDSVSLDHRKSGESPREADVDVAVVRFPRISNFDDFLALEHEPGVAVRYVEAADALAKADLVVLPGTKDTRGDLHWLRDRGFDVALQERAQSGAPILGVCGGYQMLGTVIDDPHGVEGPQGSLEGLGLLPVRTVFRQDKTTVRVRARALAATFLCRADESATGYEIHMGDVVAEAGAPRLFEHEDGHHEGTWHGSVVGTLLHGLFENDDLRSGLLDRLGRARTARPIASPHAEYDRLADALEQSLAIDRIGALLGPAGAMLARGTSEVWP
ncbi:MAG: cobyric acid synthase [Planctomycetota bacterium]